MSSNMECKQAVPERLNARSCCVAAREVAKLAAKKCSDCVTKSIRRIDSCILSAWCVSKAYPRAVVFLIATVLVVILSSPMWSYSVLNILIGSGKDVSTIDVVNKLGLLVGGLVGFALTVWRVWCVDRQTQVTERAHVTDRFLKASEQLGSKEMAVRLGGLFSLWATGRDSRIESEKMAVLDILCAFIRSPTPDKESLANSDDESDANPESRVSTDSSSGPIIVKNKTKCALRNDVDSALNLVMRGISMFCLDTKYTVELTGAMLRQIRLESASLRSFNIEGSCFANGSLFRCDFVNANLSGSDLSNSFVIASTFDNATLRQSDFTHADCSNSSFDNVNFRKANFDHSNFASCIMPYCNMSWSNIKYAIFEQATCISANMQRSKIDNSNFSKSIMKNASLSLSIITNSSFVESDFSDTNFTGADLRWVDLTAANLTGADFSNAVLVAVNCENANFTGAKFSETLFHVNSVRGCTFSDVDFSRTLVFDLPSGDALDSFAYGLKMGNNVLESAKYYNIHVRPIRRDELSEATNINGATFAE